MSCLRSLKLNGQRSLSSLEDELSSSLLTFWIRRPHPPPRTLGAPSLSCGLGKLHGVGQLASCPVRRCMRGRRRDAPRQSGRGRKVLSVQRRRHSSENGTSPKSSRVSLQQSWTAVGRREASEQYTLPDQPSREDRRTRDPDTESSWQSPIYTSAQASIRIDGAVPVPCPGLPWHLRSRQW